MNSFQDRNGGATTYAFSFPSIAVTDIKVTIDNVEQTYLTHYQVDSYSTTSGGTVNFSVGGAAATYKNTSGNTVTGTPPATEPLNVRVYRQTKLINDSSGLPAPEADFTPGSSIRAADLDDNQTQIIYATQEERDQTIVAGDIKDGIITSAKIADDTIVNADINSAAAIAGTKISPAFGSQAVSTSGTLAAGATTVTGNIAVSGTVDGRDVAVDGTKLDGIEANATADQTNAEIRAAVEAASDSNVFTDTDHNKLNGIEAHATGDQTVAEIKTLIAGSPLTDTHLASNSISTVKIQNDAINNDKIATGAVTSDSIGAGAVTGNGLQNLAVSSGKIADNAVTTAKINDTELKTLAGMQSGTASILAGSTALTADLSELNLLDGKSIVTTIGGSATDVQLPTAQAVNERVVELVNEVGGFVPIANETSFPSTNPDINDGAGTIVSIKALSSAIVCGSGVTTKTIANGAGSGNTVTINGLAQNTTYPAGRGMLVETTSTLHTYTYHRLTLDESGVADAQSAIDDFNARYRVLASGTNINTLGSLDDGDLLWDSNADKMKVYDATASAWKEVTSTGDFKFLVPVNPGTTTAADWGNTGLSNGNSGTSWDLKEGTNSGSTASVTSAHQLLVSVNGVIQKSNTGSWSGSGEGFYLQDSDTIRFATAPAAGSSVFIIQIGSAISIPTPGDNTVSTVKIQNLAVEGGKIAADAIDGTKIADDAVGAEHIEQLDADLSFADSAKAKFGAGNDLEILHDGFNSYIQEDGTGQIIIRGWSPRIQAGYSPTSSRNTGEDSIVCITDGAVELYHNAIKTFQTDANGIQVIGPEGGSANLYLYGDEGDDNNDKFVFIANAGEFYLQNYTSGSWETNIKAIGNGATELYHNNHKSLETNGEGLVIRGAEANHGVIYLYADEGDDNADMWSLQAKKTASTFTIQNNNAGAWDTSLKCHGDGAVELYHDNNLKLETKDYGIDVEGAVTGTEGKAFRYYERTPADQNIPHNSWTTVNDDYQWVLPEAGTYLLSSMMRVRHWTVTGFILSRLYNFSDSSAIGQTTRMMFEQGNSSDSPAINVAIHLTWILTVTAGKTIRQQFYTNDNSTNTSIQNDANGRAYTYWQRVG